MRIWLDKTVDEEFADLGTAGHTGTLNDRQFSYLGSLSYTGSLADRMGAFIAGGRVSDTTAPVVVSSSYDSGTGALTLNIAEASGSATCYWVRVANPSTPTTEQILAGTGGGILEAGNFEVTSGGDTDTISITPSSGDELHLVIQDAAGNNTGTPSLAGYTIIQGVGPALVYTDDFNRANEPLQSSADWTETGVSRSGSGDVVSNQLKFGGAQTLHSVTYSYDKLLTSPDQYIQLVVAGYATQGVNTQLTAYVRYNAAGIDTYSVRMYLDLGTFDVRKTVSSTTTNLATGVAAGIGASFTLRLEANGTTIRVLVDGVEKWSGTNGEITQTGQGYLAYYGQAQPVAADTWILVDDFEYGEL